MSVWPNRGPPAWSGSGRPAARRARLAGGLPGVHAGSMRLRRWVARAVVVLVSAALLGVAGPVLARGSCVGPTIAVGTDLDPAAPPADGGTVRAGQPVTVTGRWFHSGCEDTGGTTGCGEPPPDPEAPLLAVELVLRQGGQSWRLDRRDAAPRSEQYAVRWSGTIPPQVRPGPAELTAAGATLPVTVTR